VGGARFIKLARPVPLETQALLVRLGAVLFLVAGIGGLLVTSLAGDRLYDRTVTTVTSMAAIAVAGLITLLAARAPAFVDRHLAGLVLGLLAIGTALVTVAQYATGPTTVVAMIVYCELPIFAFYLLRPVLAFASLALIGVAVALLFVLQDGYIVPFAQWGYLLGTLTTIGVIIGGLLNRGVEESTRLQELRRFLAPQVADAVLTSGSTGSLLAPHRRQIAVFFCDLRGFTSFSTTAEPEEVVEVLDDYYAALGELLRAADATIGNFAGDGVMAYFNDPVPCEDPAWRAVQVALALRSPMAELSAGWERRGFHLGYGIGVAYGYATLGAIGFEGRNDYTALGSVVNLAARLSDEAADGEILVDHRTFNAVEERVEAVPKTVRIKGFADPVPVFSVIGEARGAVAADLAGVRQEVVD
jgi:class 3 adenylate cyclase